MSDYNFFCFNCDNIFTKNVDRDSLKQHINKYGDWEITECTCGGKAKLIGKPQLYVSNEKVSFWDGNKEVTMSKGHIDHIRSRAVTSTGEVLTGKKGEKFNSEAKAMGKANE